METKKTGCGDISATYLANTEDIGREWVSNKSLIGGIKQASAFDLPVSC